jgi:N-methylhydantoinase B
MSRTGYDSVTFDIIQNALQAAADEMFVAMRKTAMSAIIYEVLDMGTGITDAEGEIASSGAGIPGFIGVLDKCVKAIIASQDPKTIRPGDVYCTNDPFHGGVTHLNDMVLAMPVFLDGKLIAWTSNIAHWNDVGGKVAGSMSADASEIFQEGLRVPVVKLIDQGVTNQAVIDILKLNSRLPDFLAGDLWAQIAAVRIGEERLVELATKYGPETFVAALAHFMDYGEKVTLNMLKTLPKGEFSLSEEQDNGLVYNVTIKITDDKFIVDLYDNPDQVNTPNNATRDGILICAQLAMITLSDVEGIANGGSFRPLELITRKGSIFDAQPPSPFGFYAELEIRTYDLILRCLASHIPGRLPSGSFASICGTVVGGPHPDTGRHYTIVEPEIGGWGAGNGFDGNSAMFSPFHGETFNCPVEVAEARYGLAVDSLRLNLAEGGEGQWRGGHGISLKYRVLADNNFLTCGYTRFKVAPWGLEGGAEGSTNYVEVIRASGAAEKHNFITALPVNKGDVIHVVTGAGGGFGPASQRDSDAVRADIKDGYITAERASAVYGVGA